MLDFGITSWRRRAPLFTYVDKLVDFRAQSSPGLQICLSSRVRPTTMRFPWSRSSQLWPSVEERTMRCSQPSADGSKSVKAANNDNNHNDKHNSVKDKQVQQVQLRRGNPASVPIVGRHTLRTCVSALILRLHARHVSVGLVAKLGIQIATAQTERVVGRSRPSRTIRCRSLARTSKWSTTRAT